MESNAENVSRMDAIVAGLLRESDTLLLGLFDNPTIGVYVLDADRFVYANRRLAEIHGYTQDEIIGMKVLDLVAPEDRHLVQRQVELRTQGKVKASSYAFRGRRKDGSIFDCEVYGAVTQFAGKPAIIGVTHDVSERKAAERAVADQLSFIEKLVETIPNPIFYKDEKGRYLGCNASFEEHTGEKRNDLIGRTADDVLPGELADATNEADMALLRQRGVQISETVAPYADGSRRDVIIYKATFDKADGSLGGLVGVILDISERKRMEEAIWREANFDALTGLPNRRSLYDRLREELKRARRNGRKLALLFIDLDRFKDVNDTLGHNAGDQLLILASQRIRTSLRESDIVFRQGGDEFVVLLPDQTDCETAGLVAQKIIDELSLPFNLDGQEAFVTASIGIAYYPDDGSEMETLVVCADQAMYTAKAQGRKCFCHFTSSMQIKAVQRLEIANDLRQAALKDQFELYYQPIVDMRNGSVTKAEAQLRWNHPRRGLIDPAEFIPIADEIGVIGNIGDWVFRHAMATARQWQSRHAAVSGEAGTQEPIQIGFRVSQRQLIDSSCSDWVDCLRQWGLPPQTLVLKINESLLLGDRPAVIDALLAFRASGVQISLNDLGIGFSSLFHIKQFNLNYLKIDSSFLCDMAANSSDRIIVELMITLAHKLGMKVVARGVKTTEEHDLLRQSGCDYAQGDLFAKPMPLDEFQRFIGL
jgi:diguanylate cyclase (GGDEF)-like protein/PAS domain S-box-containing protein